MYIYIYIHIICIERNKEIKKPRQKRKTGLGTRGSRRVTGRSPPPWPGGTKGALRPAFQGLVWKIISNESCIIRHICFMCFSIRHF